MLILFDHGTPRGIATYLPEHTVKEARAQGWDRRLVKAVGIGEVGE